MKLSTKASTDERAPRLNLVQLQYESDYWKRLMVFTLGENIHLKNRLAEILKNRFDEMLLDEVEAFHSRVIGVDDSVRLLRYEIAELDKLLIRERFEDGLIVKDLARKVKEIRSNVNYIEMAFIKLKTEFNNYVSENIDD